VKQKPQPKTAPELAKRSNLAKESARWGDDDSNNGPDKWDGPFLGNREYIQQD